MISFSGSFLFADFHAFMKTTESFPPKWENKKSLRKFLFPLLFFKINCIFNALKIN